MATKRKVNAMPGEKKPLPVAASKSTKAEVFDPDYSYVVKNLKRIGVLAVIFIALLVVLSFIL